jgi:hypothetical protein
MSVDLQEADALLRSNFNDARSGLEKVESVRGQVELRNLTLAGAYDEPAGWSFATAGTLEQIEMRHADFPDAILVSHANFEASEKRVKFSNTAAAISDAALTGGGTLEYRTGAQSEFTVSGTATIGPQMTQRLSQHMELPREIKLRSPLKIVAEQFAWRTGDFSFRGEATLARATALKLDIVKNSEALVVRNLIIDDSARRARMTFDVNNETLGFSFSGELAQRTLDNIFSSFPVSGSALSGDIQVRMSRAGLAKFSALGQLSGSNLSFPLRAEKGFLKQFSIAGTGDTVLIRSADLRWGQNYFAGSGKISGANDIVLVDFDGVSDRLDWDELQRLWADQGLQRKPKDRGIMSGSEIQATIGLKTNRFMFGGFDFSSLETRTTISPVAISQRLLTQWCAASPHGAAWTSSRKRSALIWNSRVRKRNSSLQRFASRIRKAKSEGLIPCRLVSWDALPGTNCSSRSKAPTSSMRATVSSFERQGSMPPSIT